MSVSSPNKCKNIQNWDYISEQSQKEYKELQKAIKKLVNDCAKSKFSRIFKDITLLIEDYISRDVSGNNERALICGYLYAGKLLLINTRQIMQLVGKCKSSINNGFQALGYKVIQMDAESAVILTKTFPFLREQPGLTRQWTLRSKEPYVQETENDIKNLLTKTLAEMPKASLAPTIAFFSHSFKAKPSEEPSSAPSSAYTTPTREEQKADMIDDEFSFNTNELDNHEIFGDVDFLSSFDNGGFFDSPEFYSNF
jgi:hypothetical protein